MPEANMINIMKLIECMFLAVIGMYLLALHPIVAVVVFLIYIKLIAHDIRLEDLERMEDWKHDDKSSQRI